MKWLLVIQNHPVNWVAVRPIFFVLIQQYYLWNRITMTAWFERCRPSMEVFSSQNPHPFLALLAVVPIRHVFHAQCIFFHLRVCFSNVLTGIVFAHKTHL